VAIDARLFGQDRLGTGRYTSEIVKALARSVTKADFVLIGPKALPEDAFLKGASFVQHVPAGMETLLDASWEQFSLSAHLLGCDAYFSPTGILPVARPCKGIAVVHDVGFADHPGYYETAVRNHLDRWVRNACLSADMIVAVSEFTSQRVKDLYQIPSDRVRVIHHGRTERAAPPRRGQQEGSGSGPYVLCVSSMEPNKNLPMLVEAFSSVAGHWNGNLLLAGRRGRDLGQVQEAVVRERLESRVRIVIEPKDEELDALYAGAAAFVYPSVYEGFGLPLLEAMTHGLPVIANRIASCPEVVGDAGVLVERPEAGAWAEVLNNVLPDVALLQQLASAARTRALEFSWERAARETWSAIEAAMGAS
jgi:glycosyltransferase involved in cell wall biosynthesis